MASDFVDIYHIDDDGPSLRLTQIMINPQPQPRLGLAGYCYIRYVAT